MCDDGITNGGPISFTSTGGGGGGGSCPPANVIVASNVLNTNGNVLCANIISGDGTFTGNLRVDGQIFGNVAYSSLNVSGTINASSFQGGTFFGNGSGLANLNASNLSGSANLTSLNTTSLSFQNAILSTNLPILNTAQGTWGSSANVSQVTVDQYGRVSAAANVAITSSQWTTVAGNVAYQNGVSIGTLSAPPTGSNLYVLGTANIDTLNVTTLFANSATVFGSQTLNVLGTSNLNIVYGQAYYGNGSGISNINSSNLVGNVASANVALVVSQPSQTNITSVGTLTGLNVQGLLTASNGSSISNINASSLSLGTLSTTVFPTSGVTAGIYGSGANVSQVTVDQYGRVTAASNVAITSSQWTTGTGNIYYLSNVGIGTSAVSSNLAVIGNIYASNALQTTNVLATSANLLSIQTSNLIPATQGLFMNLHSNFTLTSNWYGNIAGTITSNLYTLFNGTGGQTWDAYGQTAGPIIRGPTVNGGFTFAQTGPYSMTCSIASVSGVKTLAISSNAVDIHSNITNVWSYCFRYSFGEIPSIPVTLPFYVSSTSAYYYLDIETNVQGDTVYQTAYSNLATNAYTGSYVIIRPI